MLDDEDGLEEKGKKVKVLGISCSPRRKEKDHKSSRSERLLERLMDYVDDFGGQTEIIRLADRLILPCEGCYSDSDDGSTCTFPCVHQDDTNLVLESIIDCDSLVFATPVYWGAPSSLLRILIEKMTALENNSKEIFGLDGREPLEGKPFVMLASQDAEGASLALSQTAWSLSQMGLMLLPYGMIFEPALLERPIVRIGLRLIGMRKFEWVENSIRLAARSLVEMPKRLAGYSYDDYKVVEPRA